MRWSINAIALGAARSSRDERCARLQAEGLHRLEHEQRVAAGVAVQLAGVAHGRRQRQAQRLDERRHTVAGQRLQVHHVDGLPRAQRVDPVERRLCGLRPARRKEPPRRHRVQQELQQLDARGIRELQVVDRERLDAAGGTRHRRGAGVEQARPAGLVVQRCGLAKIGQQTGQAIARAGRQGPEHLLRQRSQQSRRGCIAHPFVTGARASLQDSRLRAQEVVQQPRLAHAGVAENQRGTSLLPYLLQGRPLRPAGHQPWGSQQRCRYPARGLHLGVDCCTLQGVEQRHRLGRRLRADLVLEHLLAAVEGQ